MKLLLFLSPLEALLFYLFFFSENSKLVKLVKMLSLGILQSLPFFSIHGFGSKIKKSKRSVCIYSVYVQEMMLLVFLLKQVWWGDLDPFNTITVSMLSGDNLINLVNNFFWLRILRMACWHN